MSEDINRIMKCLTLSVEENEIKNLQSLSWAINKLENFSMTFDMLDQSRIGQTLQSVRHSKKISGDLSERIRYLIKCWRRLLDVNCISVIPNEIRKGLTSGKPQSEINGIKNGYNKESITSSINNTNGIKYTSSLDLAKSKAIEDSKPDTDTKEIVPSSIETVDSIEQLKNGIIIDKINHSSEEIPTKPFINPINTCIQSSQIKENDADIPKEIATNNLPNENWIDSFSKKFNSKETTQLIEKEVDTDVNTEITENQIVSQELENIEVNQCEKHEQKLSVGVNEENHNIVPNSNSSNQLNQENIFQENNQSSLCNTDENARVNDESKTVSRTIQIGKPKLKSTKELLADFSNLIDTNTKNKILMDKITQEDDDPTCYHPETFKLREIIQRNIIHEKLQPQQSTETDNKEEKLSELDKEIDEIIAMKKESKCDKLLKKFQAICGIQPKVVFKPMVPWKNLKRGIDCSSPCIRQSKSAIKRVFNEDGSIDIGEPQTKYTISDIDDLLQTFELRSQRKDMITAAILKRKETQIVDNTQSITDLSLKLKLKIPQQKIQILKLKKRKKKKRKKPKPKQPIIKKPRKPRIKPKPPITNYLDDLPKLSELTEESFSEFFGNEDLSETRMNNFENSDENVQKFTYEFVEGYNCTKHTQTSELLEFTKMYSILIDKTYLHVFPWVDLEYPIKSTFSSESDEIIRTALDLPQLFS